MTFFSLFNFPLGPPPPWTRAWLVNPSFCVIYIGYYQHPLNIVICDDSLNRLPESRVPVIISTADDHVHKTSIIFTTL